MTCSRAVASSATHSRPFARLTEGQSAEAIRTDNAFVSMGGTGPLLDCSTEETKNVVQPVFAKARIRDGEVGTKVGSFTNVA